MPLFLLLSLGIERNAIAVLLFDMREEIIEKKKLLDKRKSELSTKHIQLATSMGHDRLLWPNATPSRGGLLNEKREKSKTPLVFTLCAHVY